MECCFNEFVAWFKDHAIAIAVTFVFTAIGEWLFLKFTLLGKHEKRLSELEKKNKISRHIINTILPPETKTWIGKAEARQIIMQSSLMLKIVAGWNRTDDYHSVSAFLERGKNRALYGRSDQEEYEARQEEEVFQHYLGRIEAEYPEAKNKDGKYSREIIEFALKKMTVEE